MENGGWIYFRVDDGRGYCFGKTDDPSRRDAEYRKENPWIKKVYDFYVANMDAVERELIALTAEVRLLDNSKEWITHCEESRRIVDRVRRKYALLTFEQWLQIAKEEFEAQAAEQQAATPSQCDNANGNCASEQVAAIERGEMRRLTEEQSYARWEGEFAEWKKAIQCIPPHFHAQQHDAYKKQLTVFRDRLCPRCRVPALYDAALTGYRCKRCKSRCE
jgi:hypothetical protein